MLKGVRLGASEPASVGAQLLTHLKRLHGIGIVHWQHRKVNLIDMGLSTTYTDSKGKLLSQPT